MVLIHNNTNLLASETNPMACKKYDMFLVLSRCERPSPMDVPAVCQHGSPRCGKSPQVSTGLLTGDLSPRVTTIYKFKKVT